jgi:prolyl 4-hydroxylase
VLVVAYLVAAQRLALVAAIELVASLAPPDAQAAANWLDAKSVAALLRLELAVRGEASDVSALRECPREWVYLQWPRAAAEFTVVSRGRAIDVARLRPEPRLARVRGFLSAEEAAHIIGVARERLHRSRVVAHEVGTGAVGMESKARTSWSCKVSPTQDAAVMRVVQRAAFLAALSPQHAEAVQVVHYEPGQEYRPHYDWFSPLDKRYAEKTARTGNRLLS